MYRCHILIYMCSAAVPNVYQIYVRYMSYNYIYIYIYICRVVCVREALGGSFLLFLRVREALGGSFVFYVSGRLWEAHLYVFYVSRRLWEAHLYVFYVSVRLSGGRPSNEPWRCTEAGWVR